MFVSFEGSFGEVLIGVCSRVLKVFPGLMFFLFLGFLKSFCRTFQLFFKGIFF